MTSLEQTLTLRIEKLERANRRVRLCLAPAVALVGLLLLTGLAAPEGQGQKKSIRADEFVVAGPNGGDLVRLSADKAGGGRIEVFDASGRMAALIRAGDGLGEIALWDTSLNNGKPQLSIGCLPKKSGGGTQIFMHGSAAQPAVNLIAQKKGDVRTW